MKNKEAEEKKAVEPCHSHLGGSFGHALAVRFEQLGWIVEDAETKNYFITPKGEQEFRRMGVDMSDL